MGVVRHFHGQRSRSPGHNKILDPHGVGFHAHPHLAAIVNADPRKRLPVEPVATYSGAESVDRHILNEVRPIMSKKRGVYSVGSIAADANIFQQSRIGGIPTDTVRLGIIPGVDRQVADRSHKPVCRRLPLILRMGPDNGTHPLDTIIEPNDDAVARLAIEPWTETRAASLPVDHESFPNAIDAVGKIDDLVLFDFRSATGVECCLEGFGVIRDSVALGTEVAFHIDDTLIIGENDTKIRRDRRGAAAGARKERDGNKNQKESHIDVRKHAAEMGSKEGNGG